MPLSARCDVDQVVKSLVVVVIPVVGQEVGTLRQRGGRPHPDRQNREAHGPTLKRDSDRGLPRHTPVATRADAWGVLRRPPRLTRGVGFAGGAEPLLRADSPTCRIAGN